MRKSYVRGLETLRHNIFWGLDTLKGSKIRKHLNEIKLILESKNKEEIQQRQQTNLNNLLKHSQQTTTFYNDIEPSSKLTDFPVINKQTLNNNYQEFISRTFIKKKNRTVLTSGSTGISLKVIQNNNKIARNTADTIYFSELAGYKLGYKLLFLRHWNAYYKKSKLKNWLQNITPIEVLQLNPDSIDKLIKNITKESSNKTWLGFPSAFEQICNYLDSIESNSIDANIKAIIGMAEGLNTYTKQRMEYYFNSPMVSRYSNMENGILAQQETNGANSFKINWASYHIELLSLESNTPVAPGDKGRIVVTDLYNYAMPLIRYDTGDIGVLDSKTSPPTLKSIEGRRTDIIYNTKGHIVSSFIMINIVHYSGVKQMQLIQEGAKNYTIKINGQITSELKNKLITDFKKFLGDDANIKITYVCEIPLLDSGKRKITVNNYFSQNY